MKLLHEKPEERKENLPELFLLLALDSSGKFRTAEHTVRLGLAGATLCDLARRGVVEVSETTVVPTRSRVKLEAPLDKVMEIIDQAPEPQDAEQWINRFSRPALLDAVLEELKTRGHIEQEESKLLGLIPRTQLIKNDVFFETDLTTQLREVLYGQQDPDFQTGPLLYLLYTTDMLYRLMPDAKRKRAREYFESRGVITNSQRGRSVVETLQATENAVAEGLVATRGGATGMQG